MDAPKAYARAYDLLACVGLADRADAYPGSMSSGEQRRVVIARALINSPRWLLADEPTSDLDEDTEATIAALLKELQQVHAFGLVLVTHNLDLARCAQRIYEMRQGVLAHLPMGLPEPSRRHAPPPPIRSEVSASAAPPLPSDERADEPADDAVVPGAVAASAPRPVRLGRTLLPGLQAFLLAGAVILGGILVVNAAVGKYQDAQLRERAARVATLRHVALNSLRGDVRAVSDLGDGRYELTTYLQNVGGGEPIYVMSPDLRAYVQVGTVWQEVTAMPAGESIGGVHKIEGTQTYRYVFDARLRDFTQLLPNYMHVRFSSTMLISPSSMPKDDVFERKDNYYVYLKPFDIADEVVLKRMRFPGNPPVWIPMPAH
jgi:energy-coupling factor transporter ATP-binding protein EcfA2